MGYLCLCACGEGCVCVCVCVCVCACGEGCKCSIFLLVMSLATSCNFEMRALSRFRKVSSLRSLPHKNNIKVSHLVNHVNMSTPITLSSFSIRLFDKSRLYIQNTQCPTNKT